MTDPSHGEHRPPHLQPSSNIAFPPSRDVSTAQSPARNAAHRQSFSESFRGLPSPRVTRHTSISQNAFQELLNNPPLPHKQNNPYEGRDWKSIKVLEVIDPEELHWSELDTPVEDATTLLVNSGAPNVVLIRAHAQSLQVVSTFDYSDLNAYLLLVVGLTHPDEQHVSTFNDLARKGRTGKPIPLRDIENIGKQEAIVTLSEDADLTRAVEIFGSGVHRIIITRQGTNDAVGVLTQLRLVRFFWEFGRHFPAIEPLFSCALQDLKVGSRTVKNINGDRPLSAALELMSKESITSLPVLDNSNNVVGNISHVDVRLLTKSTSIPLLRSSCIHFIAVILSERGVNDGKDSFPVFYVQHYSTLAHTVAKLVATRSHRMWIVDSPSPNSSTPQTPATSSAVLAPPPSSPSLNPHLSGPPHIGANGPAVSASALPGQSMSGRLTGVISLTDVLNLFARVSGLDPSDPEEARRMRRRSSSSVRSSSDLSRSTGNISSSSISQTQR